MRSSISSSSPSATRACGSFKQEFVKDVPSIVLKIREDLFLYNKDLKNWHPNAIAPFDNMMDVDI